MCNKSRKPCSNRRQWLVYRYDDPHCFLGSGYLYKPQNNLRQKFSRALIFAGITFVTQYRIWFYCRNKNKEISRNIKEISYIQQQHVMLEFEEYCRGNVGYFHRSLLFLGFQYLHLLCINTFQQGHWKAPSTYYNQNILQTLMFVKSVKWQQFFQFLVIWHSSNGKKISHFRSVSLLTSCYNDLNGYVQHQMSHKGKTISSLHLINKFFLFGSRCNYVEEIIKPY